jgi:hypothetical protein
LISSIFLSNRCKKVNNNGGEELQREEEAIAKYKEEESLKRGPSFSACWAGSIWAASTGPLRALLPLVHSK